MKQTLFIIYCLLIIEIGLSLYHSQIECILNRVKSFEEKVQVCMYFVLHYLARKVRKLLYICFPDIYGVKSLNSVKK